MLDSPLTPRARRSRLRAEFPDSGTFIDSGNQAHISLEEKYEVGWFAGVLGNLCGKFRPEAD
jgi:hypothetical protein